MRIKKRVSDAIDREVAGLLIKNREYTAKELKREAERSLKQKGQSYNFTERTYLNIKTKQANKLDGFKNGERDKPWVIGACLKYGIPSDRIPLLLEIKQRASKSDIEQLRVLTVRQACWVSKLWPVILESDVINAQHRTNSQLKVLALFIAEQYAQNEQIAEVMGETFADTSELDSLYFIDGNADIIKGFLKTHYPEQYKRDSKLLASFKPLPEKLLQHIFGDLTEEELTIFNQWLSNFILSQTEPIKGYEANQNLLQEYQDLQWMVTTWNEWLMKNHNEIANLPKSSKLISRK
jgi:hypothetical protein